MSLKEIQAIALDVLDCVVEICKRHGLQYYLAGGTMLGAVRHSGFIPWDDDIDIMLPREDFDRLAELCRTELPSHYSYVDYNREWRIPNHIAKVVDKRTIMFEEVRPSYRVELGVCIDIFPLDGTPRNTVRRAIHYGKIMFLKKLLVANAYADRSDRSAIKTFVFRIVRSVLNEHSVKRIHSCLDRLTRKYRFDESDVICNYAGAWGVREQFPKEWLGKQTTLDFEGRPLNVVKEYDAYLRRLYGDYMTLPPPEQRLGHYRRSVFWR